MGLMIQWSRMHLGFAVFQVHELEGNYGLCMSIKWL